MGSSQPALVLRDPAQVKTQRPSFFKYPEIGPEDLDFDGYESNYSRMHGFYQALLRYWSFHRATSLYKWPIQIGEMSDIGDQWVISAIQCVTEAISISRETEGDFALWSDQAVGSLSFVVNWPDDAGAVNPKQYAVARPGYPMLLPINLNPASGEDYDLQGLDSEALMQIASQSGHHTLVYARIHEGRVKLENYDSFMTQPDAFFEIAWRKLKKVGWVDQAVYAKYDSVVIPAAQQYTDMSTNKEKDKELAKHRKTCGIHTILNAWAVAMGLKVQAEFKPTPIFLHEAKRVINLALSGHMDSKTLFLFLKSTGYIKASSRQYSSPDVHKFPRTVAVHSTQDFEKVREVLVGLRQSSEDPEELLLHLQEIPELKVERSPDSPNIPLENLSMEERAEVEARKQQQLQELRDWFRKRNVEGIDLVSDAHLKDFYYEFASGEVARRIPKNSLDVAKGNKRKAEGSPSGEHVSPTKKSKEREADNHAENNYAGEDGSPTENSSDKGAGSQRWWDE